jgi:hypothetical protein
VARRLVYPGFLSPVLLSTGIQRSFSLLRPPTRSDVVARDIGVVGEHPVRLPELADHLLRRMPSPTIRHDLTSLPARDSGQQDNSQNHRT